MKRLMRKLSLGIILLILLAALATPVFAGTLATEAGDWAYPSAPTFTAVLGSQTITGNLGPTPDDGQDPFNVNIPSTLEVTSVSYSGPGGPHNLVGCGLTGTSDLNQTFSSNNSGCQLSWFINTNFAVSSSPWTVTIVTQNKPAPPPPSGDTTPPVITPNISGTPGDNGWYVSDVEVIWSVSDAESTVSSATGCETTQITSDTLGTTLTCEATSGGGSNSASVTIKRDATPPTVEVSASPEPSDDGWYNSDVTVSFNGSDATSGIANCTSSETFFGEGVGYYAEGSCTDNAGNSWQDGIDDIDIDMTAPTVSVTGVADGATYSFGAVPTAGCETSDLFSGVATEAGVSITGGNPDGSGNFTATCAGASDRADNSAGPVSVSYTVLTDDTPPVITPNINGILGDNDWYISDVEVLWSVSDAESTVNSTTGCEPTLITSDTADTGITLTCEATSFGGANSVSITIKRDATRPSASATVSPEANTNGWHNSDVTVSFNGADAHSGLAACSADVILNSEGSGQSADGACTDNAGNFKDVSIGGINIDRTAPVLSAIVSSTPNANGWHNGDVTVSFTCADEAGGSGIATNTVAGTTLSSDGANQSVTNSGECIDNAGNSASSVTVSGINIDKSAPTASATVSPAANANGWHNSDVTVSFSGADATSDIAACDPVITLSSEGSGQSAGGACTDNAGNVSATVTAGGINIDKTAPVVSVTGVADGTTYILGDVPTAGCDTQDALSGIATAASLGLSGANADGSGTITATCAGALDNAGNSGSASVIYTVLTPQVATANIQAELETLKEAGILNKGQANGLIQPLNNAIRSLDKGKITPACSQLGDFIAGVNTLTPDPLDAATAADLIADAAAIQQTIGCASAAGAAPETDAATSSDSSIDQSTSQQETGEKNNKVFLPLVTS